MKAYTESERQALIARAKHLISWMDNGSGSNDEYDIQDVDLARIALASLEAEPVKTKLKYSSVLPKFIGDTNEVESVHCWVHGNTPDYPSNEEAYAEAQKMVGDLYEAPPVPTEPVSRSYTLPDGWKMVPIELLQSLRDSALFEKADYESRFAGRLETGRWKNEHAELTATYDAVNSLLATATPQQWIKCSERMPKRDGAYLIWDGRYIDKASYFFGSFHVNQIHQKSITHWLKLPEPPEVT